MEERIQKTALAELGTGVGFDPEPIAIRDVIIKEERPGLKNQNERAHNLAVLFRCYAEDTKGIDRMVKNGKAGWFGNIPKDILPVHKVYDDVFRKYGLKT